MTKLFDRQIIRAGKFLMSGASFEVTADTLKHWADTFNSMKANGVKVPLKLTHDSGDDPEKSRGWVKDIRVEGDALIATLEVIDDDADALMARSGVSIFSPGELVDGAGQRYTRPITHVALTTEPLIPGLAGPDAIAASLGLKRAGPRRPSRESIQAAADSVWIPRR